MAGKSMRRKAGVAGVPAVPPVAAADYGFLVTGISELLERARRHAARSLNAVLTATYWEIGRRIVEYEQGGRQRAEYGGQVLARLAEDLTARHGRGFSRANLQQMRLFYAGWEICQTPSGEFEASVKCQAVSAACSVAASRTPPGPMAANIALSPCSAPSTDAMTGAFPLSWSHYVRLMSVDKAHARAFYESEAIRGGWSVRQLDRQISTQFFERTSQSKRQAVILGRAQPARHHDMVSARDEVRDPYLLEFLDLRDEYGEGELEDALIRHMEWFLLELGVGFAFVARQKRIRVGTRWYRIDLLLYHRGLRCLVAVDLKRGPFTHADAGQMNLYLNYVKEHLTLPGESDPVGVIFCTEREDAVVKYATGGIRAQVFASKYLTDLPQEDTLRREILAAQRALQARKKGGARDG